MNSYLLTFLLSYTLLSTGCGTKVQDEPLTKEVSGNREDTINKFKSDTTVLDAVPKSDVSRLEFDRTKWTTRKGKDYPFRLEMYKRLMSDTIFRSLEHDEVLSVLGKPDRSDGNFLFYTISQKRLGALPINTKTLVIKFKEDNTIEWIKLHG